MIKIHVNKLDVWWWHNRALWEAVGGSSTAEVQPLSGTWKHQSVHETIKSPPPSRVSKTTCTCSLNPRLTYGLNEIHRLLSQLYSRNGFRVALNWKLYKIPTIYSWKLDSNLYIQKELFSWYNCVNVVLAGEKSNWGNTNVIWNCLLSHDNFCLG